ncbi:uncharacterized protein BJ212DRAFT_1482978 [Suillus subaureus]|uniref:Histone chaperone domain-containing protein n=1 Tax=Suillus subaureus TaxID=48587 RepID=A0A9P7E7H2_9AGAM|nr:uncharacterized protein BJ212DRAFT_1482978 [Suillus subaureus]KAG1812919.1 hypothetical protein BJ212DRAFT_1482978 [Suillus subaureus]
MATPSAERVRQATTKLLEEARAKGKLRHVMPLDPYPVTLLRLMPTVASSLYALCTAKAYKTSIKKTVVDYLARQSSQPCSPNANAILLKDKASTPPNEADGEKSLPKPSKKRKVGADEELVKPRKGASKPKTSPGKSKKGKQVPKSSVIVDSEASKISEDEVPARKKQVKPPKNKAASELQSEGEHDDEYEAKPSGSKRSQKASKTKKSTSKVAVKEHKSASTVESSGDEADAKRPSESVVTSLKKEMPSPKKSPSKEKPLSKPKSSTKQNAKHEADDEFEHGASSSTSKPQEPVVLKHARPHSEPENDSDVSVVIDEPPKKRRKKQEKDSNKKALTERKKTQKSNIGGSKDDETVSKLKAIVVACGVRKMWKKEFADLDTPSGQIKRLKEILKDLGMTGRLTLEKAKTIKAERELAQELRDVQDFAEAERRRETRKEKGVSEDEQSGSGSDDEDEGPPVKRKKTAGASILAFLGDQSDDE